MAPAVLGVRSALLGQRYATGTKRPDRSCGRWLGLGDWGMAEIFHFAVMRRRVRHGALTMRLRSHFRSAVKTASWRAFAAVDTFGLVWLFSGHDTTHAIAAAGAVGLPCQTCSSQVPMRNWRLSSPYQFVLFAMSSSTGFHLRCSVCTKVMASAGDIARV